LPNRQKPPKTTRSNNSFFVAIIYLQSYAGYSIVNNLLLRRLKGEAMTKTMKLLSSVFLFCCAGISLAEEQSYSMLICLVSNGIMRVERYTSKCISSCSGKLDQEIRKEHTLLALNLGHNEYTIEALDQFNTITLHLSTFTTKESLTINWQLLSGNEALPEKLFPITFSSWQHHDICNEEPPLLDDSLHDNCFKATFGDNQTLYLSFDSAIQSIGGFVIPTNIPDKQAQPVFIMNTQEAIAEDILIPAAYAKDNQIEDTTDNNNFDDILNAMEQDGTIEAKPTSLFMTYVQSIGGKLLVRYIALKEYLQWLANRIFHRQESSANNVTRNNMQPTTKEYNHAEQPQ
jgi:hypothetical protein